MKNFSKLFVSTIVILFGLLSFVSESKAQYAEPVLSLDGRVIFDKNEKALTDYEVRQLIGEEIYSQTYVGATKQYSAGTKLITYGAIGFGVGIVSSVLSVNLLYNSVQRDGYTGTSASATMGYVLGALCASLGASALSAGIPLKVIGKKRLEWIVEDYNQKALPAVSLNVEGTQNGIGLVMRF